MEIRALSTHAPVAPTAQPRPLSDSAACDAPGATVDDVAISGATASLPLWKTLLAPSMVLSVAPAASAGLPAAVATPGLKSACLGTLQHLSDGGAKLTRRRRLHIPFLLPRDVAVAPEKFVQDIEQGQARHRVTMAGGQSFEMRGMDDLAALAALYGSGVPSLTSHPGLAAALKILAPQVVFVARDAEAETNKRAEAGPMAAWQSLTSSPRFSDLAIQSRTRAEFRPATADEVVAYSYFCGGGSSADLEHPELGSALTRVQKLGATFGPKGMDALMAYVTLARSTDPNAKIWLSFKGAPLIEADRKTLESDPDLERRFTDASELHERLAKLNPKHADVATRNLLEPDSAHAQADREQAMGVVLGLDAKHCENPDLAWKALVEVAGSGSLLDAAREMKALEPHLGPSEKTSVVGAWKGWRAVEGKEPASMPLAEKRERYTRLLDLTGQDEWATKAFSALYGDGQADQFMSREGSLQQLMFLRKGKDRLTWALSSLELLVATRQAGENLAESVEGFGRTLPAFAKDAAARSNELLGFLRKDLPKEMPAFLSYGECAGRCQQIVLKAGGDLAATRLAWTYLAKAASPGDLADREDLLESMVEARANRVDLAVRDLQALEKANSLSGDGARRLLPMLKATGSLDEASRALKALDTAALPRDPKSRDNIFQAVAEARRSSPLGADRKENERGGLRVDAAMEDYWYVVRNMDTPEADPGPLTGSYTAFLRAAGTNSIEARQAHSASRLHLQGPGPFGLDASTREGWLLRSLKAAGTADGAWRLMRLAESAPSREQAEARLESLEALVPLSQRLGARDAFADSVTTLERLTALPPGSQAGISSSEGARALLAACDTVDPKKRPKNAAAPLDLVRTTLLDPATDLTSLTADLKSFTQLATTVGDGWVALSAWPTLRKGPQQVPTDVRADCLARLIKVSNPSLGCSSFEAACQGAADTAGLRAQASELEALLPSWGNNAAGAFRAIRDFAASTAFDASAADLAARRARYVNLAKQGTPLDALTGAFALVKVPVGREDLPAREEALLLLFDAEQRRKHKTPLPAAVNDYRAVASHLYPGDSLNDAVLTFVELADTVKDMKNAADVVARIQTDRLQGMYGKQSLAELLRRYLQAFVVAGNADRAWESLRREDKNTGGVQQGETEVVVGGVRIPRVQKPEE